MVLLLVSNKLVKYVNDTVKNLTEWLPPLGPVLLYLSDFIVFLLPGCVSIFE